MEKCATIAPLSRPHSSPAMMKAGSASQGMASGSENFMPITAETASIEPTERSIPAVRITKVIPAASTRLIAT